MTTQHFNQAYGANPAENYERYFVPSIGKPLAEDLMAVAALRSGERVLDVACGTAIVARLAAEAVGETGSVAGLDVNAGMLAVAQSATPPDTPIEWYEASAEQMPLPDESVDVVLCQLGLQFVPDKLRALREMRRVLADGGRLVLTVAGPTAGAFATLAKAMARHIGENAAGFVEHVFSLHDTAELHELPSDAGFRNVVVQAKTKTLHLPAPRGFLWQYIHSTPLASIVTQATEEARSAMEREVVAAWHASERDGGMTDDVRIVVASGWR